MGVDDVLRIREVLLNMVPCPANDERMAALIAGAVRELRDLGGDNSFIEEVIAGWQRHFLELYGVTACTHCGRNGLRLVIDRPGDCFSCPDCLGVPYIPA